MKDVIITLFLMCICPILDSAENSYPRNFYVHILQELKFFVFHTFEKFHPDPLEILLCLGRSLPPTWSLWVIPCSEGTLFQTLIFQLNKADKSLPSY